MYIRAYHTSGTIHFFFHWKHCCGSQALGGFACIGFSLGWIFMCALPWWEKIIKTEKLCLVSSSVSFGCTISLGDQLSGTRRTLPAPLDHAPSPKGPLPFEPTLAPQPGLSPSAAQVPTPGPLISLHFQPTLGHFCRSGKGLLGLVSVSGLQSL